MNISVVIPTYNGSRFIRDALTSVYAQSRVIQSVIVVDDASTDGTPDLVASEFPQVTLIRKESNGGFGATCNVGIQRALAGGADFVCLLNQDLIIEESAMEILLLAATQNPRYGIVSTLSLSYDGQIVDPLFRRLYLPAEYWDDLVLRESKDLYEVKFAPAAAILLRAESLYEVGGFDPLFRMYCEDNDLCDRFGRAGWRIGIAPGARVRHEHGVYGRNGTFQWELLSEYNHAVLYLKASPRAFPLAFAGLIRHHSLPRRLSHFLVKPIAFLRCLVHYPLLVRARLGNPFPFRREPAVGS